MQNSAGRVGMSLPGIAITGAIALLVLALAAALAFDQLAASVLLLGLAATPILIYLALRHPMIFPFGLYALLVPFDPLLRVASGTGGTITRFVGIATIAALALRTLRMQRIFAPPGSWLAWAALMVWCVVGQIWTIDASLTGATLGIVGNLFALYTVVAIYPISPSEYLIAKRSVIVAGLACAGYGFYAYAVGQRMHGSTRLSLRAGDLSIDPNHYAAFFAIPIALLAARMFLTRKAGDRGVAAFLMAPMFVNILLTGSRGGLSAAVIAIAFIGIRAKRYLALALTFGGGLILSFLIPNVWARVLDPTQGDASGRSDIWAVGAKAFPDYWLLGSGFGTFPEAYNQHLLLAGQHMFTGWNRPAHDLIVQSAVELGVVGLPLVLWAFWTSARQNTFVPRISPYFEDRIAYEGAMIAIFVNALSIDLVWFKYLWLTLMLVAMLANVVRPRILWSRRRVAPTARTAMPRGRVRASASS